MMLSNGGNFSWDRQAWKQYHKHSEEGLIKHYVSTFTYSQYSKSWIRDQYKWFFKLLLDFKLHFFYDKGNNVLSKQYCQHLEAGFIKHILQLLLYKWILAALEHIFVTC